MNSFLVCFTAVFVALDIIGTIPMYLTMTKDLAIPERNRVVNTSMIVATVVAFIFIFLGQKIFHHLGITLFDFKIAGGIILLLVSLADLLGGPETHQKSSGSTGIVPLAVPLITGPGVLTTLLLQVSSVGHLFTILAMILNYAFAWVLLRNSETVTKLIGKDGTTVLSKIAALLLAAISISMVRTGIYEAISVWKTTQ